MSDDPRLSEYARRALQLENARPAWRFGRDEWLLFGFTFLATLTGLVVLYATWRRFR